MDRKLARWIIVGQVDYRWHVSVHRPQMFLSQVDEVIWTHIYGLPEWEFDVCSHHGPELFCLRVKDTNIKRGRLDLFLAQNDKKILEEYTSMSPN